jgi:hypothetical protein
MKPSARKLVAILAGVLLLTAAAAVVHAHVNFKLTGKITKWDKPWMTMDSREHGSVKVKVEDDFATILRAGKPGTLADLKVGHEVDCDGWGDTIDDLEALQIDIDPVKTPDKK